jgi:hypothetical protein
MKVQWIANSLASTHGFEKKLYSCLPYDLSSSMSSGNIQYEINDNSINITSIKVLCNIADGIQIIQNTPVFYLSWWGQPNKGNVYHRCCVPSAIGLSSRLLGLRLRLSARSASRFPRKLLLADPHSVDQALKSPPYNNVHSMSCGSNRMFEVA